MKKRLFGNLVLAFILAVVVLPAQANADVTSSASATLGLPVVTAADATGAPVVIDWTAGTGADTWGSFSGVSTTLNGDIEPYNADYAEGVPWQNTYTTFTQGTVPNTVTGSADTHSSSTPAINPSTGVPDPPFAAADRLFASSALALSTAQTTGSIFAEAVLGVQFTVPVDATLTVSLPYSLLISLFSIGGDFNYTDAIAALYLYDFFTTDPITGQSLVLAFQEQVLSWILTGDGNIGPLAQSGTLNLQYSLLAGTVYDFEASATVHADAGVPVGAAVPEPISLVLLGSGMIGLAIFRKRFA